MANSSVSAGFGPLITRGRPHRRPIAALMSVLLFVGTLSVASPSSALPVDAPWTGGGTATFEINSDGSAGPAQFTYDDPDTASAGAVGNWFFETTAANSGNITTNWDLTGFHAFFNVSVGLEGFVRTAAGTETFTSTLVDAGPANCCTPPSNGFSYTGSVVFPVQSPGDVYGFRITGSNSDADDTLFGTLSIDPIETVATLDDFPVTAGTTTSATVRFTAQQGSNDAAPSAPNDQLVTEIYADIPEGFSYVPGSAALDLTGDGAFAGDPGEPTIVQQTLTWQPAVPFSVDVVDGLALRFDLAVATTAPQDLRQIVTGARVDGYESRASVLTTVSAAQAGSLTLQQAVPLSGTPNGQTGIVGRLQTSDPATGRIQFRHSNACTDGLLAGAPTELGVFDFADEGTGELFFTLAFPNSQTATSGFVTASFNGGPQSPCIVLGPDNDSWVRALDIALTGTGVALGSETGVLDSAGQARWFKFDIDPSARATINLSDLPDNYDLAVFKDISQAYTDLSDPIEDLNRLSAEFAPSVFSPSVFSPSVFSPSVFSPDAYSPSVFSPSVFSPSVFSPSVFSPSVFSPSVFSPSVFSPSVFSPSVFSPSVFSPSVFSPSVFSPSVFSPSVFSPSVFSPDNFSSAQQRSLIAVSANGGNADELVVADTWNNTGSFYVRVSGRNGAFDPGAEFALNVELDGQLCTGVSDLGAAPSTAPASDVNTIIAWDPTRMSGTDAEISALATKLDELATTAPGINGVVVDLSTESRVEALQVQAEATTSCVHAKNLVADSIKDIIDSYRPNNPVDYVVLVGGDDAVPFFRYPDQALLGPEQDFDPPVGGASAASLQFNYILGQDEYGSRIEVSSGDGIIPIPDLAVGRVVETATEASDMIDIYLGNPVVTPSSTLVTGYDFLEDAANVVNAEFTAGLGAGGTANALVDPADQSPQDPNSWTATDLEAELLNSGRNDLVFLAGHFSANSALAADYETSLITTDLAASDVDMENTVVFSAGCHSGYNIVLGDAIPGVTLPLDWAQAFAQKGATLIGGTGYQYGDTDFLEYSERLYADFARELRTGTGARPIGQAMVDAKVDYLSATPDMRGLHRKAVIISTVFGLPMLGVDMQGERVNEPAEASVVSATTGFSAEPGLSLGTSFFDHTITPVTEANTVQLDRLDGQPDLTATYYRGPNGVVTNPAEPAIPLVSQNVSVTDQALRGVGFRGGEYTEETVLPLTGAPTTELRGVHTPFASESFFPMRLATANYFGDLSDGRGTRLNTTPAQHRVNAVGDLDTTLRLYDTMELRLYYSDNTQSIATANGTVTPALAGPPGFSAISAEVVGDDVVFEVFAVGDPAAGVQEVWITYTRGLIGTTGTWVPLDLVRDSADSSRWTATIANGAALGPLDYTVHAANGVGMVTADDNFGSYYQIVSAASPTEAQPTVLAISAGASGTYGDRVDVSATLTLTGSNGLSGQRVIFTLGESMRIGMTDDNGVASATLPLTSRPGSTQLTASFAGADGFEASSAAQTFTIAKAPTMLVLSTGASSGVVATLTDNQGGGLKERTVYFTVSGASGDQTVARITNQFGVARLDASSLPSGSSTVTGRFLGTIPLFPSGSLSLTDTTYESSSDTELSVSVDTVVGPVGVVEPVAQLGDTTTAEVTFSPATDGSHTAEWSWGDGTTSAASITSLDGIGTAVGTHTYASPGVYEITVTVTDGGGAGTAMSSTFRHVVIRDQRRDLATGAGWINSPAGAFAEDPTLTSRAYFWFFSQNRSAQSSAIGRMSFRFPAGGMRFDSTSLEWLVVSGPTAQVTGEGTINGSGDFGFLLTASDSNVAGGGSRDALSIKIWDLDSGETIYDNARGADQNGSGTTALSGGSIRIRST